MPKWQNEKKSRDLLWKECTNLGEVRVVLDIVIL